MDGENTSPKKVGKYEITAEIGRGAMGIVYKARDPSMGRLVALKTITGSLKSEPELFARFCQEARSAGALEHPNIVTIYELNAGDETPYIAMAYLEGESLEKVIARRPPIPISQKLGYMVQVCRALDYAHQHGVIHRDIKPGNVVVTTGGVIKVVDFGIAHLVDASKTKAGMVIGTLAYMSPQQLGGERADERFDIWAAGVMFYELLAYQRPFSADSQASLVTNILTKEPHNLQEIVSGCPAEVNALVWKMLRKAPAERLQSFQAVLIELEPLWRRTAQEAVATRVADSEKLFECRDYQKAQALLRSALQIDSQATHAKALLEKVNAEIKRLELLPKVKEKVARAQQLLNGGELEQAKAAVESALQIDSRFQPARDLLAQLQEAGKRQEQVRQMLSIASQHFAQGALSEALLHVDKVLQIDAGNLQAQELRRKVQEESARREKRKKLLETLQMARSLWAQLRYDECIAMLTAAQKDFPGESEILNLLETARQEQAEQQRQLQLKEARNLLAAQHLTEALALVDNLLAARPSDPTALSLRTLVVHEQEVQAKQERLFSELAVLRTLINQGKYEKALEKGEDLRRDFPQEHELTELVEFARGHVTQLARKRSLEEKIKALEQLIAAGDFQQALASAEKLLLDFPGNVDLLALRNHAHQQQKEKERHDLLEKRIREIKGKVCREEFSDAIDLAQQTLYTVGPDTDVQQLLKAARKEYDEREKKRNDQDCQLQAARASLESGDIDGASRILDQGLATRMFNPADERVRGMFTEIQTTRTSLRKQRTPAPARPSTTQPMPFVSPALQPVGPEAGGQIASQSVVAQDATATASVAGVAPSGGTPANERSATGLAGLSEQATPLWNVSHRPDTIPEPVSADAAVQQEQRTTERTGRSFPTLLKLVGGFSAKIKLGLALMIAAVILIGMLSVSRKGPTSGRAGYVEVNAQPWAMVITVTDKQGKNVSLNQATPVRLSFPEGQYTILLAGPAGTEDTGHIEVVAGRPTLYTHDFEVVDVKKIVDSY